MKRSFQGTEIIKPLRPAVGINHKHIKINTCNVSPDMQRHPHQCLLILTWLASVDGEMLANNRLAQQKEWGSLNVLDINKQWNMWGLLVLRTLQLF